MSSSSSSSSSSDNSTWGFGDNLVPFADPAWYSMPAHLSPFYDESHRRVRAAMREWVRTEIEPHVDEWDDPSKMCVPADLPRKAFEAGWLASTVLDGNKYFPDAVWIGGVPARDWTPFHSLVMLDELARAGSAGLIWNITGGLSIGIPPVLHYGTQRLKDMVMPCLRGEKRICLAITEATAGSDVSAIKVKEGVWVCVCVLTCTQDHCGSDARQAPLYCQWPEEVDYQRHHRRLLHRGAQHGERHLAVAGGARPWGRHAKDALHGCSRKWHVARHL